MRLLTLDYETFYERKTYSVKHITPAEYVLDRRFECICVSVSVDLGPVQVIDGPDFPAFLAQFDPADTITLTFNSLFDNAILAWRYGFVPVRMIDGLGMARYCLGHRLRKLGLGEVSHHLGVGEKGKEIAKMSGVTRAMLMAGQGPITATEFWGYAAQDTILLNRIFQKLAPQFPMSEYDVMDLVLRAAVCPVFQPNVTLLEQHRAKVIADKEALIAAAQTDKEILSSSASFTALLESLGIEVATKVTKTGNIIPAVAKTDDFMKELQEHPDPFIQALAAARLGVKSTLEEARSDRLISIAHLPWDGLYGRPVLPIPLRYHGAHTCRLSGDWKINMQNLPSGRGGRSTALRDSLEAPEDFEVVVGDLGQIEARLTAWLSHAPLFEIFVRSMSDKSIDPYKYMASQIFGIPMEQVDETQRGIGKAAVLGLGFGLGVKNFYIKTVAAARMQNKDITGEFTPELAKKTVDTYRRSEKPTVNLWAHLNEVLRREWMGLAAPVRVGPVTIGHGYVEGPKGLRMQYHVPYGPEHNAEYPGMWDDMYYQYGGRPHKIYGAAFLENIIQFLARIILFDAAVRMYHIHGFPFANTSHDELGYVVHKSQADYVKKILHKELTTPPIWAPDLPLKASINKKPARSYGEAK